MGKIKENIIKMKELSELLLDLSYSAVFLHDKKIALQVDQVYDEIKNLEKDTLRMIFKIRESENDRLILIDLTASIRGVANETKKLAELAKSEHPITIIRDILTGSSRRIIDEVVSEKSAIANKKIGDSSIRTNTRAHIVCLKRKDKWMFDVDKETRLLPGDLVVAVGREKAEKKLVELLRGKKQ